MRKILATGVLAAGLAAAFLPVAPASAYCDAVISELTGRCDNSCTLTARTYHAADDRARDLLPDVEFICPM